jgi:hypothetical protein
VVKATLALARRAWLVAIVTRAQEGWSGRGGARVVSQVELSDDLPLIIELVAATERIEPALPELITLASEPPEWQSSSYSHASQPAEAQAAQAAFAAERP